MIYLEVEELGHTREITENELELDTYAGENYIRIGIMPLFTIEYWNWKDQKWEII